MSITLSQLNAVENNEEYLQMPFNAYYTNLEIALMGAYYLSSIAYPNEYKNFNIEAKCNEISQKFLGKDYYQQIISKPSCSGGFRKIDNLACFISNNT